MKLLNAEDSKVSQLCSICTKRKPTHLDGTVSDFFLFFSNFDSDDVAFTFNDLLKIGSQCLMTFLLKSVQFCKSRLSHSHSTAELDI